MATCAIVLAAAPAPARAKASIRMTASFAPARLGAGTTLRLGFKIRFEPGEPPVASTRIEMLLPRGLGIASSELGLATCTEAALLRGGAAGCPHNSLMGRGWALTEVPFGSAFVREKVRLELFSGAVQDSHPQLLFSANGSFPVIADLVFGSLVLPAAGRFGATIDTSLPLVPSVPGGPDVALVALYTTIGPEGITYEERVKGRLVRFRPSGIQLPSRCPHNGFAFGVGLSFLDGSTATTTATVPCPRPRPRSQPPRVHS